ncbi:GNAT family N-acetyltransferase [Flexivirga oryzae]|uniref:RimJ/RimL family protein N-acetyltransferase n=1 Tax=Flexivirga oryzae TaxID=1794944 RepID=A0A839NAB9_9MICO|nr:GNAT family protein [Flexivirga oryzae]MBB2894718.1 RimJ/RimL family protein N-acetyltransferase [Flexivirga oryzae]
MTSHWPFDELAIRSRDLALRPVRDQDVPSLLAVFPDDFDLDPGFPPLPGLPPATDRERRLVQSIWRHRGCWSVDDWALDFGVWRDGAPIGIQTLEGTRFRTDRTVDTASWIAKAFRGSGFGRQARASVLTFAFECLDAQRAVTSAVTTNQASLGVSRRLGYRDAGMRPHDTGAGIVELQHLVLTRDEWRHSDARIPSEINGFDTCRPFFGPT